MRLMRMTAGPCGASAEPLVESRAHDPGVKLLGERLRLLQETEPHRRIHPNLKVGVRVEAHDRKPALLHTRDRRFEPVTLKALCFRLGSGNLFFPGPIGGFSPRLEPRGYDGRDRRRQNAWRVVLQDMDIVLSYEQRQGMFDQIKPSLEFKHDVAVSRLSNLTRMTQSIWAGGFGGITVCSMKPGNAAMAAPMPRYQEANSSSLPARTRVWVTMLHPPGVAICGTLMTRRACRRFGPA